MKLDVNIALQYIVDHQQELLKADPDLLDSVEVLLTLTRWEMDDIARVIDTDDNRLIEDMFADFGPEDHDTLMQQSEEYLNNVHRLKTTPPEDTQ